MTTGKSPSAAVMAEVLAVLASAESLLRPGRIPTPRDTADVPDAMSALDEVWRSVRQAAATGATPTDPRTAADLLSLALRTKTVQDRVRDGAVARRSTALGRVHDALAMFRESATVSELITLAPAAVTRLGFDRAIFSRVQDGTWVTETVHVTGDEDWAREILAAGRNNPQRLVPELFETDMARHRRAVRVTNVQLETRVHRAVADASSSRDYVAAPVTLHQQVIGFLHADNYFQPGEMDEFDRELLAVFTEGFSYALDRAVLADRLSRLRSSILEQTDGLTGIVRENDLRQQRLNQARPEPAGPSVAAESLLTRREAEILRHLAAGHTNAAIAATLVISEGTVKSHVKHILRKLGAGNRAEAVSIFLTRMR